MTTPTADHTPDGAATPQFTLTRLVDASRQTVWQLWTDPAELTHWFHPRGASTPLESISVDLRVGGRYRYTMIDDRSGGSVLSGGVYLEVSEPHRLAFTWGHPDDPIDDAPVVTVSFTEHGEQTEITVHVRGLARRPGSDTAYDGWDQTLDVLVDWLANR